VSFSRVIQLIDFEEGELDQGYHVMFNINFIGTSFSMILVDGIYLDLVLLISKKKVTLGSFHL